MIPETPRRQAGPRRMIILSLIDSCSIVLYAMVLVEAGVGVRVVVCRKRFFVVVDFSSWLISLSICLNFQRHQVRLLYLGANNFEKLLAGPSPGDSRDCRVFSGSITDGRFRRRFSS